INTSFRHKPNDVQNAMSQKSPFCQTTSIHLVLWMLLFCLHAVAANAQTLDTLPPPIPKPISELSEKAPPPEELREVKSEISQAIDNIVAELEVKYPLQIAYKSGDIPTLTWGYVTYETASKDEAKALLQYLQLFATTFQQYPPKFVAATNLQTVAIVKKLAVDGQFRAAVPDWGTETLLLDFFRGASTPPYQEHVIHHEYYHLIEEEQQGTAYWKDPKWLRINKKSTEYGEGGASAQGNTNAYYLTNPSKGYLNLYSISALEEDKAEVYATLFVATERAKLMEWRKTDRTLRRKARYMQRSVRKIYYHRKEKEWKEVVRKRQV
ncbi:MAG: hypothetical protein ACPGXL_09515, partial [Chitinophagales bacterium]